MIRAKYILLIASITFMLAINALLTGCKKCYTCYEYFVSYSAIKGAYSYGANAWGQANAKEIIDSLKNIGYTIDTESSGYGLSYYPFYPGEGKVCGKNSLQKNQAMGDSCVEQPLL